MKKNNATDGPRPAGSAFYLRKADHDPRAAALSALSSVLAGEADSQEALDRVLQSSSMPPSDKGLCTELLYGQLRACLRLQWFSAQFLKKPEKLPWEMRLCLEQALYSMAFLRMPHRAAVHWAVEHVRNRFGQGLAGAANGALRSMQRELAGFGEYGFYREKFADELEALAVWRAVPVWIVRLWREAYGEEKARELLEISSQAPPQGLRLNRARPGWEKARELLLQKAEEQGEAPGSAPVGACGLLFEHGLPYEARQLMAEGRASRQSAASYAALETFEPGSLPGPLWDCCAGRGGKTMALLERGLAVALASDPALRRLKALRQEYERLRLAAPPCPAILVGSATDAADFSLFRPLDGEGEAPPLPDRFGAAIVDAPCTGLGTLGRRPEIRFRRSPEDCRRLTALQAEILEAVWQRLAPGGRLVYLTCTANPAENGDQIRSFMARRPEAVLAREYEGGEWRRYREYFYGATLEKR